MLFMLYRSLCTELEHGCTHGKPNLPGATAGLFWQHARLTCWWRWPPRCPPASLRLRRARPTGSCSGPPLATFAPPLHALAVARPPHTCIVVEPLRMMPRRCLCS